MATAAGRYLYKILPPKPVQTIPLTLPWYPTELDAKDGFVHLSTARRIPVTLSLFFADVQPGESVTLVRILRDRLTTWKKVDWPMDEGLWGCAHLKGAEVEQSDLSPDPVRQLVRQSAKGEKSDWTAELEQIKDWLLE